MERYSDVIVDFGDCRLVFGDKKPTYRQFFGLWLNRIRANYRKAHIVAIGTKIGSGKTPMSIDYYRAVTNSEIEARMQFAIDQAEVNSGT